MHRRRRQKKSTNNSPPVFSFFPSTSAGFADKSADKSIT